MKILVLGQSKSCREVFAKIIGGDLSIPVIWMDENCEGYEVKKKIDKQNVFCERKLELYNELNDAILVGNTIYPNDYKGFDIDIVVVLTKTDIIVQQILEDVTKYVTSDDYNITESDKYLMELFQNYYDISLKWAKENLEVLIHTPEFETGVIEAKNKILAKVKTEKTK